MLHIRWFGDIKFFFLLSFSHIIEITVNPICGLAGFLSPISKIILYTLIALHNKQWKNSEKKYISPKSRKLIRISSVDGVTAD